MSSAAILISRQPILPTANCNWVRSAIMAVKWLSDQGYSIFTSEGLHTFELLIYLCVKNRTNQIIVISATDMHQFVSRYLWIRSQFDLQLCNIVFIPLADCKNKSDVYNKRDKYIIENSDLLIPVSIREGGSMSQLIIDELRKGKRIDRRFEIGYESRSVPLKYSLNKDMFSENINSLDSEYVIHWTRTSSYCWPGERLQTYYQAITESLFYPRNAFLTLLNIITTRCIKSSTRHMPGNIRVVSFTGSSPSSFSSLMKWRTRYKEMSFEPYGIGIKKKTAFRFGIRPVFYIDKDMNFNHIEKWLIQPCGKHGDWPLENEYRFSGDLDLSIFPIDQLICFCLKPEEARFIREKYSLNTISFLN